MSSSSLPPFWDCDAASRYLDGVSIHPFVRVGWLIASLAELLVGAHPRFLDENWPSSEIEGGGKSRFGGGGNLRVMVCGAVLC